MFWFGYKRVREIGVATKLSRELQKTVRCRKWRGSTKWWFLLLSDKSGSNFDFLSCLLGFTYCSFFCVMLSTLLKFNLFLHSVSYRNSPFCPWHPTPASLSSSLVQSPSVCLCHYPQPPTVITGCLNDSGSLVLSSFPHFLYALSWPLQSLSDLASK